MHGIQAWVALPVEAEENDPSFQHHAGADLPEWEEHGVKGRLIAGEADGLSSRVTVHSPLFYQHWEMQAGARSSVTTAYPERAVYCAAGQIEIGGTVLGAGQMAVLNGRDGADVAANQPSTVMVLGGEPIGERFLLWNFVSSSKDRLEQAREDWTDGRMKLPDADHAEFIPFPEVAK